MVEALAVTYVASHPNSGVVQARLWPLNRDLVLRAMVALYQKDATNISRVLDVSQVGGASVLFGWVGGMGLGGAGWDGVEGSLKAPCACWTLLGWSWGF